jgi:UDP-N-acetylglucosamine 2-epimerase (non-hydrolysing)
MIAVVFGTTGELIKLAPVLHRLHDRRVEVVGMCTGQQIEQIPVMIEDFGLPRPEFWLACGFKGNDLERPPQIPYWFSHVCSNFLRNRREIGRRLRGADHRPLLMVHGDTFTTVIGAAVGRSLRVPVAHLEAGLRSGDWRNPFPEELNRRATTKLARIHFAPGNVAVRNLASERARGEVIDTTVNTVRDNLHDIPAGLPPGVDVPRRPFGIVSIHRYELLKSANALRGILEVLRDSASRAAPLVFIDHPVTVAAIRAFGLGSLFDAERFVRIPRQRYFHFLSLLKASSFLVTDSGGSQEECAYLGHPCLIHRLVTDRHDGLDGCVVLSHMQLDIVRCFLEDPERLRHDPMHLKENPSDRVVRFLEESGFVPAADRVSSRS